MKSLNTSATTAEKFQLMPDRTDVTITIEGKRNKTHGFWFTWDNSGFKSMSAADLSSRRGYGSFSQEAFDFSDKATTQQWIILSEDELAAYQAKAIETDIREVNVDSDAQKSADTIVSITTIDGITLKALQKGVNIVKYKNGQVKKIFVE